MGNQTGWQIEQGCPQCGAPVTLEETDRLLVCPFCRTRLFLSAKDHFRYYIPPRADAAGGNSFTSRTGASGVRYSPPPAPA